MEVYVCEVVLEETIFSVKEEHLIWKFWRVELGDGGISKLPAWSDWKTAGHRSGLAWSAAGHTGSAEALYGVLPTILVLHRSRKVKSNWSWLREGLPDYEFNCVMLKKSHLWTKTQLLCQNPGEQGREWVGLVWQCKYLYIKL